MCVCMCNPRRDENACESAEILLTVETARVEKDLLPDDLNSFRDQHCM